MCGRCGVRDYAQWKPRPHSLDLGHLRERPAMYVGATGATLLHRLVDELIDNSVNEVLAKRAHWIGVTLLPDGAVTVSDDGPGIRHSEVAGIFGNATWSDTRKEHPFVPTFSVGVVAVSALAARLEVVTTHDAETMRWAFARGVSVDGPDPWARPHRGTTITFEPDREIFRVGVELDSSAVRRRLRELTLLCPGLVVTFRDRLRDQAEELHASAGVCDFVRSLGETPVLAAPVRCHATSPLSEGGSIDVDIALQWDRSGQSRVLGFVNTAEMNCGGTHEHGLRRGLKRAFPRLTRRRPEAAASGLTAVVSVLHPRPRLRGTSHVSLESEEVGAVVARAVETGLEALGSRSDEVARLTEWLGSR
ncbi:MAG: hypothetical protein KF878_02905 [Planctomycetes bacterium]|nr:hypothetical protein [Planctomycetota bacterium]